jgi:hypothetical protein
MEAKPIEQVEFRADELIRNHPPRWHHSNKRVVFDVACSSGFPFEGPIAFARWEEQRPTGPVTTQGQFHIRLGVFDYAMPKEPNIVYWHVNFADPELFVAYGSPLLAQDELQVAEHPILGSLRDALKSKGRAPMTIGGRGNPTPVTISGVQRRCAIDTLPNPDAGRHEGLYGNAFARAPREHIIAATKALMPPTITNILAMAAPACGYGDYTEQEIAYILNAAFTGFSAARRESRRIAGRSSRTVIHTGFWGCGAFGGNRSLMSILQALAGDLAGVDIVFWAFDKPGLQTAHDAYELYLRLRDDTVSEVINELLRRRFRWGESDGN